MNGYLKSIISLIKQPSILFLRVTGRECEMYYSLPKGEVCSLKRAKGERFECLEGELWLTVLGQNEDFVIRRGDIFTVPSQALTVIQALSPASFQFLPKRKPSPLIREKAGYVRLPQLGWWT